MKVFARIKGPITQIQFKESLSSSAELIKLEQRPRSYKTAPRFINRK